MGLKTLFKLNGKDLISLNARGGISMQKKKIFISYSWDSNEHQEWVLYLANDLRKKRIRSGY